MTFVHQRLQTATRGRGSSISTPFTLHNGRQKPRKLSGIQSVKLTVYFDGQFWIGIFEKQEKSRVSVSKHIFGVEPKDSEVYDFILNEWKELKFSPTVEARKKVCERRNPKARQRKVKKMLESCGVGTKAQQAIKLQIEDRKIERKIFNKKMREENKTLQYNLQQQQKKEKHKGH